MNKKEFNWAILGTGVVANEMANALKKRENQYMQLGIEHTAKQLILQKNMECKKYTTIFMKCFLMKMWT